MIEYVIDGRVCAGKRCPITTIPAYDAAGKNPISNSQWIMWFPSHRAVETPSITCNHFAVPATPASTQRLLTIARCFVGRPYEQVRKAAIKEQWKSCHCRKARTGLPPDQSSCDHWPPPIVRHVAASVQACLTG